MGRPMKNVLSEGSPIYVRIFFALVSVCVIAIFVLAGILAYDFFRNSRAPHSAIEFDIAERDFVEKFVLDQKNGGYNYWVERDGSVRDSKKYSIFQANMILWLGGIQSQKSDQKNIVMIKRAADYLVKYLYKGNGEWLEFDSANHRTKQEFFWNPRTETYIAYALFQAYRITDTKSYLRVAIETTKAQREKFPQAVIYADYDEKLDIGYRFPEHLGQYQEFRMTREPAALAYAQLYDMNYRGRFAKELLTPDGKSYYYHGMATLAQLIYGYVAPDDAAFGAGSIGRESYWSTQHDDGQHFDPLKPGESSDNGRDYYDKRIAMDLVEWSKRNDDEYRHDALDTWETVKSFWDQSAPYGFLVNTSEDRKTCFTIGMPMMLMDLTPPKVVEYRDVQTDFWNHQLTVTLNDPEYKWNDIKFRGIGMDPTQLKFHTPWGFIYGPLDAKQGPCETCVTYTKNLISPFWGSVEVYAADLFGNASWITIPINSKVLFGNWGNWNTNSTWFYLIVLIGFGVSMLTCAVVIYIMRIKQRKNEKNTKT